MPMHFVHRQSKDQELFLKCVHVCCTNKVVAVGSRLSHIRIVFVGGKAAYRKYHRDGYKLFASSKIRKPRFTCVAINQIALF